MQRRQRLGEKDADEVAGVRCGQRQQIDIGRDALHLARLEDQHAKYVADQTDDDERQRRTEVDSDGHHHSQVLAAGIAARPVDTRAVRTVVIRHHCFSF